MLTLPIKKIWFDMILSGIKKEEYREINRYYTTRLNNNSIKNNCFKNINVPFAACILRNGYSKNSPSIKIEYELAVRTGNPLWGAEIGKEYYVLMIVNVIQIEVSK